MIAEKFPICQFPNHFIILRGRKFWQDSGSHTKRHSIIAFNFGCRTCGAAAAKKKLNSKPIIAVGLVELSAVKRLKALERAANLRHWLPLRREVSFFALHFLVPFGIDSPSWQDGHRCQPVKHEPLCGEVESFQVIDLGGELIPWSSGII